MAFLTDAQRQSSYGMCGNQPISEMEDYLSVGKAKHRRVQHIACLSMILLASPCIGAGPSGAPPDDHETPSSNEGPTQRKGRQSADKLPERNRSAGSCNVDPGELAEFANGETFHFEALTDFLSDPSCQGNSRESIAKEAVRIGVKFSETGALRLDGFAKNILLSSTPSAAGEAALRNAVPPFLRSDTSSAKELLPLLGQLALLSPTAARFTLAEIQQRELAIGDTRLSQSPPSVREKVAKELALSLVNLGADKRELASEFASSVEELALLAQADSLARLFRALSAAAAVESGLVTTLNLSAGAFNRGVQRGLPVFGERELEGLRKTAQQSARIALKEGSSQSVANSEFNESLAALLGDKPLTKEQLKRYWEEIVQLLGNSRAHVALSEAVGASLTDEILFLDADHLGALIRAADLYPELGSRVQVVFVDAWEGAWTKVGDGSLPVKEWRIWKQKYAIPFGAALLSLDPASLKYEVMRRLARFDLITDDEIEKRLPRQVLTLLNRRLDLVNDKDPERGLDRALASLGGNFAVSWTLQNVQLPILMEWVRKQEHQ